MFDNITSYILFVSVLGYIAWRSSSSSGDPSFWERSLPKKTAPFLAVVAVLLVWGAYSWINAPALTQNRVLLQSLIPQAGGISKNLELIKNSIGIGAFGIQEAREQLAQMASRIASASEVDVKQKQAYYDAAVSEMQKQHEASPLDARAPLFLGIIHNSFGNYLTGADALSLAHKLSPRKQSILFEIALNAEARGDSQAVLQALEMAYNLEPANVQARIFYATVLIRAGENIQSDKILAPIIATGEAADPRIASAYLTGKQYGKIVAVWEARVLAQPDDAQGYFTLAAAYYALGNTAKAISTLEAASTISPGVAQQAASFIQQIRDGSVNLK